MWSYYGIIIAQWKYHVVIAALIVTTSIFMMNMVVWGWYVANPAWLWNFLKVGIKKGLGGMSTFMDSRNHDCCMTIVTYQHICYRTRYTLTIIMMRMVVWGWMQGWAGISHYLETLWTPARPATFPSTTIPYTTLHYIPLYYDTVQFPSITLHLAAC